MNFLLIVLYVAISYIIYYEIDEHLELDMKGIIYTLIKLSLFPLNSLYFPVFECNLKIMG